MEWLQLSGLCHMAGVGVYIVPVEMLVHPMLAVSQTVRLTTGQAATVR